MHFLHIKRKEKQNKSKNILTKLGVLASLVLFIMGAVPAYALTSQEIDQQIKNTDSKLLKIRTEKNTLTNQVAEFDSRIQEAQLQINSTQNEINITNNQITNTNRKIIKAEQDLKKQKELMGEYLRTMYVDGQISTIELIAKAKNFSDFVDQSEYMGTMQQNVQETANKIVSLKDDLNNKKKDLEEKKAKSEQLQVSQVLQRQSVDQQRAVKNNLLQTTKGSESSYQALLSSLYQQRAALSAKNNEVIGTGGSGGYPYSNSDPNGIDPWGMYYRQCTSYAAWRSANYGPVPGNIVSDWGHGHTANGGDWGWLASSHGFIVNYIPAAGAIMSFPYGPGLPYGHVAIVTSVNPSGTVNISEYNWSIPLGYGTRSNVNPANYGAVFIH